jgi:hypothetical protein
MPRVKASSSSKGHLRSQYQKRSKARGVSLKPAPRGTTGKNTVTKGVSSRRSRAY